MTAHPIAWPPRWPPHPAARHRRKSSPGRRVGGSLHARRVSRRLQQPAQCPHVRRDGNPRRRPPRCSCGCPFVGRATTRSSSSAAEGKCSRRRPQRRGSSYLGAGRSRVAASKSPRGTTAGRSDPVLARVRTLATGQRSWRAAGPLRRSTEAHESRPYATTWAPAGQPSSHAFGYKLCSGGVSICGSGGRIVLSLEADGLWQDGQIPPSDCAVAAA
jgi:hypothetical protein